MEILLLSITIAIIIISGYGFFFLIKEIRYVTGDTCSLFRLAESIHHLIFRENNCIELFPNTRNVKFQEKQVFLSHNVFINILKLFPSKHRLKCGQTFNFLLIVFCATGLVWLQTNILSNLQFDSQYFLCSILFSCILLIRTKIMLVVAHALSDVVNYLIFVLIIIILYKSTFSQDNILAVLLGSIIGLAFRNRAQDLILFTSTLAFILFSKYNMQFTVIYVVSFIVMVIDSLYVEFVGSDNNYKGLNDFLKTFGPFHKKENSKFDGISTKGKSRFSHIKKNAIAVFNLCSPDSYWPSLGGLLLISPLSAVYLIKYNSLHWLVLFTSLYFTISTAAFILMRLRYFSENKEHEKSYFGGRQAYILFIVLLPINGVAFSAVCNDKNYLLVLIYISYIIFYICHQTFRIIDYHLSDTITEGNFTNHLKIPEPWRVELFDFIINVKKPVVVLGDHFVYGKIHNFFMWRKHIRCIDVYRPCSDEDIVNLIEDYTIDYVILTPFSPLRSEYCTLGKKQLSQQLSHKLLLKNTTSPNLIIYAVIR